MRDLISSSIGSTIELQLHCAAELPPALADPNQLELAILNLCVNARDAMPNGGLLIIAVEPALIAPGSDPRLAAGLYVRLSVIDSGTGMDSQTLAHAVEPFFSTKELGRGTGLGLSMVHGLTAQLGGAFMLSSVLDEGTRADLYLPATDAVPEAAALPGDGDLQPAQPLSVLVVDDEPLVRRGVGEMLRDLGHQVVEAEGGADALELIAAVPEIDLIVTDYKMPRMDGAEFAARVRESRPEMPILLISGYTGAADPIEGLPRLNKPFGLAELAAALRRATEQPAPAGPRPPSPAAAQPALDEA
jgi:CheY-like chemotaxis protein